MDALSQALDVDPSALLYGVSKKDKEQEFEPVCMIPLLSGSVSAGQFERSFLEWQGETIPIPWSIANPGEMVAWKVRGCSMEPEYKNGETVVIDKSIGWSSGDDVIACRNGDDLTIKKIRVFPDGTIELRPYNPDYPVLQVKEEDEVVIYGVVVSSIRTRKNIKK